MPEEVIHKINPAKPPIYFHYAGLTNTGRVRGHNEDAYILPETDTDTLATKGHLYVLADGMGGHQKGEVASEVTIKTVNSEYYATVTPLAGDNSEKSIIKALSSAIEQANTQVMDATEGGGTTVVAAVLYNDLLVSMNVGDSRAYLLRDNQLRLISKDHSLVSRLVEMGKITEEDALTHPRRNVLYQALGQGSEVDIHIYSERLKLNDTVILCSDGLWGEVPEEALKEVLTNAPTPLDAAQELIDLANASGGPDNITAIIIQVSDKEIPTTLSQTEADNSDTEPSLGRPKPDTLPEGKYHIHKSEPE